MTGETSPAETALPEYATAPRPKRVKRVRLALLAGSVAACISVSLMGFLFSGLMHLGFGVIGLGGLGLGEDGLLNGAELAFNLASLNFFLFFITVPSAAMALGFSVGRLPHRGITALAPYLRWGAIWGGILVGCTTGGFGLFGGPASAFGALVAGGFIGGVAGGFCGFLMHRIIAPARQLTEMDVSVF